MAKLIVFLILAAGGFLLARRFFSPAPSRDRMDGASKDSVEDMRPCPVCGTYRPVALAARCDRSDCPFPGDGASERH